MSVVLAYGGGATNMGGGHARPVGDSTFKKVPPPLINFLGPHILVPPPIMFCPPPNARTTEMSTTFCDYVRTFCSVRKLITP